MSKETLGAPLNPFKTKKRTLLTAVGVILFGFGFEAAYEAYADYRRYLRIAALHKQIAELCLQKNSDSGRSVPDQFRNCVHSNTKHSPDAEFFAGLKDKPGMLQGVIDHIEGRSTKKKHFECSTRSYLLVGMLKSQGYKARDLITAKFQPQFSDHVVVEVWNAEENDWEVHDPSHDTYFRTKDKTERLSLHEMVEMGANNFIPCLPDGRCGWHLQTAEGHSLKDVRGFWGNMVVKIKDDEWQVIYNSEHFDPQKPLDGQTYCQKREKFCRLPPLSSDELKLQAKRL